MSEPCLACGGRGFIPDEKVCANERCGKRFRYQEGRATSGQYRAKGVIYCSSRCARAELERRRRRRVKLRASGGE